MLGEAGSYLPDRRRGGREVSAERPVDLQVDKARGKSEIIRFEAFVIWQDSPKPGETQPTNIRKRRFLRWPETGAP